MVYVYFEMVYVCFFIKYLLLSLNIKIYLEVSRSYSCINAYLLGFWIDLSNCSTDFKYKTRRYFYLDIWICKSLFPKVYNMYSISFNMWDFAHVMLCYVLQMFCWLMHSYIIRHVYMNMRMHNYGIWHSNKVGTRKRD